MKCRWDAALRRAARTRSTFAASRKTSIRSGTVTSAASATARFRCSELRCDGNSQGRESGDRVPRPQARPVGARGGRREFRGAQGRDVRHHRRVGLGQIDGRALRRLPAAPTGGKVTHFGKDPFALSSSELRQHRRAFQIIFQDPNAALDPRMTIVESVREPLDVAGVGTSDERTRRALAMLDRVALAPDLAYRYPHEISGGQKQRANIAPRAGAGADADRVRRSGGGARRVDPGRHAQPVRGPATRIQSHLSVHQPRPARRRPCERSRRRDVFRQDRRTRSGGAR